MAKESMVANNDVFDAPKWQVASAINQALEAMLSATDSSDAPKSTGFTLQQIYETLERPPEAHLGDYAFPCFRLARVLRQKPASIAEGIKTQIEGQTSDWIKSLDVVGAFLNVTLQPSQLATHLLSEIDSGAYFSRCKLVYKKRPSKVMVEYSQPNTHKIFHVGHMRNVALGDSLGRIYEYCGYPVVFANYIGDEGAHIAKCIWYIQKQGLKVPDCEQGEWLGEMYVKATLALDDASPEEKKVYEKKISEVLAEIESKQGETYEFWKASRQWSIDDFQEIYDWTGARFDHWFAESEVSEESQLIVDEYLRKGVFVSDDGAVGVDMKDEKLGFLIVRKSDGNTTYGTKDLALARRKFTDFDIDESIYVVASEQNLHFRQVFKTLEKMGFQKAANCHHLSYGMVVLPEGKMSSRTGNVIAFKKMRESLTAELSQILKKYEGQWSADELADATHKLAVGAIRYGMVCSDPIKDIVFDLDDWLSFEGNTGPYLMYSYARTKSILKKADAQGLSPDVTKASLLAEPEVHELLRYMNDMNEVIRLSCELKKPSSLAHHLFDTCKVYNRFLAQISVLKADGKDLAEARLALLDGFAKVLKQGLELLGMVPPERM